MLNHIYHSIYITVRNGFGCVIQKHIFNSLTLYDIYSRCFPTSKIIISLSRKDFLQSLMYTSKSRRITYWVGTNNVKI